MQKAKRTGVLSTIAGSIKPPGYKVDPTGGENHKYLCVYVTAQGKQVTQRCTHDVWKRCEGRNVPGRPRDGLSDKVHCQFIIWVDPNENTEPHEVGMSAGLVTSIDIIPETFYQPRQTMPEEVRDRETIAFKVDQKTGAIEVTNIAPGVTRGVLERLIRGINDLDEFEPGDMLPGGFEVTTVSGRNIEVMPPVTAHV